MKSRRLKELSKLSSALSKSAWSNYQALLRTVFESNPSYDWQIPTKLLSESRWDELIDWADGLVNTEYSSPREHRVYHQIAALIRKYPFPSDLVKRDPRGKAIEKFETAEQKCKAVNEQFKSYLSGGVDPWCYDLAKARSYISYVLGEFSLSEVWDNAAFGAGASLGIHGNATNLARKLLAKEWTVTHGAYYYARASLKTDLHLMELLTERQDGSTFFSVDPDLFNEVFDRQAVLVGHNKVSFVPKDATAHRAIATEPLLNGYLQKGVDVCMRKRLLRVGLDLSDQSHNQSWALQGSELGDGADGLATIDLSSASDSISLEVCRYLLPPDWFDFLNSIRSSHYALDGVVKRYEKFVSMGNGFCFPLETLIFASLCHAAQPEGQPRTPFLVYGDDIVVRNCVFHKLLELLTACGFTVNPKKTFCKGPFRESCGSDWFEGEDVRPIILDYALDSFESIAKFCNGSKSKECWNAFLGEGADYLRSLIPHKLFLVRPYRGNPDTCFEVPWDVFMASPFSRYRRDTYSWSWVELVKSAVPDLPVRRHARYHVALIAGALRGAQSSNPFTERYSSRTKLKRISTGGAEDTTVNHRGSWYRLRGITLIPAPL